MTEDHAAGRPKQAIAHSGFDDSFTDALLSTIPFGVDVADMSGTILFASPAFAAMVGSDPVGKKCWDVYKDDQCRCEGCPIQYGFGKNGCAKVTSHGLLGGRSYIISHAPFVYRGENVMMKLFQDVTDHYRQREELLKSNERFTRIVEGISDVVYSLDMRQPENSTFSKVFEQITGYSFADVTEKGGVFSFLADAVGPVEFKFMKEDIQKKRSAFSGNSTREWWMNSKSGKRICFEDRARPVYDEGKLVRIDGILRDITDRKISEIELIEANIREESERQRAARALQESEDRYRNLFDLSPDPILVVAGSRIEYINGAGVRLLAGEHAAQIIGCPLSRFIHPDMYKTCLTGDAEFMAPLKQIDLTESLLVRLDGTEVQVEIVAAPFKLNDKDAVQFVARDISARKKLESTILIGQKMADVGTLAAGVAHEINSPLQVITGVTQSLIRRIDRNDIQPDQFKRDLEVANRNAWRCASIARALLTYSRPSTEEMEEHGLNELITEALLLIEHQLKSWSNIFIHTKLCDGLPVVLCNRNQIMQVLLNLVTNARDAMPEGGDIWIESRYDGLKREVLVQVEDTGTGIPEHLREKVFNPFFTTKPFGKGTGLGLSISLGIIKSFGGDLRIARSGPAGTAIVIVLPEIIASLKLPAVVADGGRYSNQAETPIEH